MINVERRIGRLSRGEGGGQLVNGGEALPQIK